MAEIVETIEENGRKLNVYKSGAVLDAVTGKIVKPAPHTLITAENNTRLHRARQEKQARLLRAAIVTETMDKLDVPAHGSAAAVAAAGGILWREIVLSPDAYPRDRMEAWEKLGKYAQVLADPRDKGEASPPSAGRDISQLTELVRVLAEAIEGKPRQVVEGKVSE